MKFKTVVLYLKLLKNDIALFINQLPPIFSSDIL